MMKLIASITAFLLSCLMATSVAAHPHVWIEAKAEVVLDDEGRLTGVRNIWRFDEAYTAFAIQGMDANGDGEYSTEELRELADINIESLKDFEYFTYVQEGDKEPPYDTPSEYWLTHDGGRLTLYFTVPLKEALAFDASKLTIEVFDPTFFVDVGFVESEAVSLAGGPAGCQANLQRAQGLDDATAAALSEIPTSESIPLEQMPEQGLLSNTIRVACS